MPKLSQHPSGGVDLARKERKGSERQHSEQENRMDENVARNYDRTRRTVAFLDLLLVAEIAEKR